MINNLSSLLLAGIGMMLLLSLGIIFFVILYQRRMLHHQMEIKHINERKQQELLQASIQSEEEERMRIASELHDDVGATLSSIRLFLHKAAQTSENPEMIHQSRALLDESIKKVRDISHKLQPATLQQLGLKASLEALSELINSSGSMKMQHSLQDLPRMDENTELAVYRVMQELINNILKHAHATSIHLRSTVQLSVLQLTLSHDGVGLTEAMYQELIYKKGAIGLKNIVNRIKAIQSEIRFAKAGESHYEAIITIPLNRS
jgi:signal transduction histidine kinase